MKWVKAVSRNGALMISAILLMSLSIIFVYEFRSVSGYEFLMQDRFVVIVLSFAMILAWKWRPALALPARVPGKGVVVAGAVLLALLLWAGTYIVFFNYPLTYDEFMAGFDARVFAGGHLAQPVPAGWRSFVGALLPYFLLDVPDHRLLISAYMPVNAAMRALFGMVFDPALMNPALAGAGFVAIYRLSMRLFADEPGAVWTVLIGYAVSAQILGMAMTAFAMTGHLALNLLWLLLFLRGRWLAWGGAMVVGFLATGLHQIVFHPLFAAPFILRLAMQRRWAPFAAFCAAYLAMLGFWISYPHIIVGSAGIAAAGGSGAGMHGFIAERVWPLLAHRDHNTVPLMIENVLRGICWNAGFILPLLILAWPAIRRRDGVVLPLLGGILLTLLAVAILMPEQGHGWGYRYIHGVLGNILLLAGYGYREIARSDRRGADGLVVLLGSVSLFAVLPFVLASAHQMARPPHELARLIERQRSDFVVLDTMPPVAAARQVHNLPDFANRPLIFSANDLAGAQIRDLCRKGTITLIGHRQYSEIGLARLPTAGPEFDKRIASIKGQPCLRPVVDQP